MPWSHFIHGADIGVRGSGSTREEAFAQAALALTAVITEPERIAPETPVAIDRSAPDEELLLADWLNAIVYEMATRRMLFSRFEVQLAENHLRATAWGEPVDVVRHTPAVEVKGATLTGLRVAQREGVWTAECVVDV